MPELPAAAGPEPPDDLNEKPDNSLLTLFEPHCGHSMPASLSSMDRTSSSNLVAHPSQQNSYIGMIKYLQ